MSQLITINHVSISHITYKDEPVVTAAMIAEVHGISEDNVYKSFQRNKEKFTEGKHFYRIDYEEASLAGLRVHCNPNGVTLFTQRGYALLTKPMRDQKSWQVQEQMIDEYFVLRKAVEKSSALDAFPEMKAMAQMLKTVAELRLEQRQQREALIATQAKTIEALERSLEASQQSQRAETKSDMALDEARRMTLEEFILCNGLIHQFPYAKHKQYSTWLRKFCLEHGLHVPKAPVLDKPWDNENAYPLQALAAWLRYEQTKPKQIRLDKKQEER